jgi:hypothetical protein
MCPNVPIVVNALTYLAPSTPFPVSPGEKLGPLLPPWGKVGKGVV